MTVLARTDQIFFEKAGMDRDRINGIVGSALAGADDGELFLEYRQSEGLTYDDGRLRSASFDTSQGFGLSAIADEAVGYSHASELSEAAINRLTSSLASNLLRVSFSGWPPAMSAKILTHWLPDFL